MLLLLATLLAACGGQQAAQPTAAPAATAVPATQAAATAAATAAPEAAAPSEAAPEASAEATTAADAPTCKDGERLFSHKLLETAPLCIPENPQRIVALDIASVELLLMLGKTPVLTSDWLLQEMPLLLPQYAEKLGTITDRVGYPAELEKVALAKPDLILTTSDAIDVKLASAIAPVVVAKADVYNDWKLGTEFWAEALNEKAYYGEMLANYEARVAELRAALGKPEDIKVSVMSVTSEVQSLWMPDTPPGTILSDVGLSRPEAQSLVGDEAKARYNASQYISISKERLDLADGDAIFYFTYASTDPATAAKEGDFVKSFQQDPIWLKLGAVKNNKAFFVPGYWWRSQSYLLANLVLDDLFTNLAGSKATTPVLAGR